MTKRVCRSHNPASKGTPPCWSMRPWIAAPKPARNDEFPEAEGKTSQMR